MPTIVTQFEHHVQEEANTNDVIEDPKPEDQVPDSIAAHKPKRIYEKPAHFSNMIVAYALLVEVVKDSIPSTFEKQR